MVIRAGLVGCGYWGKNHLATLRDMDSIETRWVCDQYNSPSRQSMPHNTRFTKSYLDILSDRDTDAVIIATPTSTHHDLAKRALESGKHVLVEKPLTANLKEAQELVALAREAGKVLMVGHIFKYNPAVSYMEGMIERKELGDLRYLDARRVNPGPIREDMNSFWDLGCHDVYIATHLIGEMPSTVSYQGTSFNGKVDDVSNVVLKFPNGVIANIYTNWMHPIKERNILVGGSKGAVSFRDTEPANKIHIYNMGVDFQPGEGGIGAFQSAINSGDARIPKLPFKQPLREELQHFAECISKGVKCRSDGNDGVNVLKVLEAADRSRLANGLEVRLQ
ncbi:MAG: Gfo/Idh/MocA family oxidoreductase [Nanoarchaeota archaeon]